MKQQLIVPVSILNDLEKVLRKMARYSKDTHDEGRSAAYTLAADLVRDKVTAAHYKEDY